MGRRSKMEGLEVKDKEILVITGGAGFIGSHLVEAIIGDGYKNIVVLDKEILPHSYFLTQKLQGKVTFECVDIRKKDDVFLSLKKYNPTYIFHLAAEPIVDKAYADPVSAFETNIMGTVYMLEAARKLPSLKCFMFASSDKAYGKTTKEYTEQSPLKGDHPYDVSKSSADLICQAYYKTYNMPVIITRFGNVYGEGDLHFDRIIPGICESLIEKKPLQIRSDGSYIRDYIYVKDIAAGCILLLQKNKGIIGEAFNFSSQTTCSVLELVERVKESLRLDIPCTILNIAKNEIPYQHLNDSKIKKLGWVNQYSFDQAIKRTFAWYKHIL